MSKIDGIGELNILENATLENTPIFFFNTDITYNAKILSIMYCNNCYVTLAVVHDGKCVQVNGWTCGVKQKLEMNQIRKVKFTEWQEYEGTVARFEVIS